ncbi:MAG: NAD(P)-dependent oxidoreductase [Deltaproteobacteria bacterium]|nr:NAD(P)-dependent oxidoreductase [Deltaproteobacteria bacterium]
MRRRVLITGSSGLVGTALRRAFASDFEIRCLDLRGLADDEGDVLDADRVAAALRNCDGVIHLAAISRVVHAERQPDSCWSTNVSGLTNVLRASIAQRRQPWVIFASSREVYGQPEQLPVDEECPLQPMNVYGRSKVEGERLVAAARRDGLRAAVVRLSNVYGSTRDHADRVVPAFARAALSGRPLRVEGTDHSFDFTHIDDVARGIAALASSLLAGGPPPAPIHFVSGTATTLGQLAQLAIDVTASASPIELAPPRDFDVARFCGAPARARVVLGWSSLIPLREGLTRLVNDFRAQETT